MSSAMELTTEILAGLPKNGPTDPIEFYRRPVVGWLFRERINLGLRLIPSRRYPKALEIGYGAGAVLAALAGSVDDLHGLDLDADPEPVKDRLAAKGQSVSLVKGSLYQMPYETASMDLVVCFSVFEHLHEYKKGLIEVARVLRPGGYFLLGMPAVNKLMEGGFRIIGFKGIEDHHVTTPQQVANCFSETGFAVRNTANLGLGFSPATIYFNWLLERKLFHHLLLLIIIFRVILFVLLLLNVMVFLQYL